MNKTTIPNEIKYKGTWHRVMSAETKPDGSTVYFADCGYVPDSAIEEYKDKKPAFVISVKDADGNVLGTEIYHKGWQSE